MNALHTVAMILLISGGLNWLLFALTGTDVGSFVGGTEGMDGMVAKIIYILVGLSALYELAMFKKWMSSGSSSMQGGMTM